jgi:hypothetical protein
MCNIVVFSACINSLMCGDVKAVYHAISFGLLLWLPRWATILPPMVTTDEGRPPDVTSSIVALAAALFTIVPCIDVP